MPKLQPLAGAILPLAALFAAGQAQAQGAPKLFIQGDMVRGVQKEGLTGPGCVLASQFKRKEEVVWRLRVLDAKTGQPLDDKGLKSLVVELPDGQKLPARFGNHPPPKPVDTFWSAVWVIPETYPTGSLTYKVTATSLDGESVTWEPFKTAPSQLAVIPGDVTFIKPGG